MRCCLATWFTADVAEVGEACLSTLRRYGERHDIAVRANFRVTDQRPAPWAKLEIIQQLIQVAGRYLCMIKNLPSYRHAEGRRGKFEEAPV